MPWNGLHQLPGINTFEQLQLDDLLDSFDVDNSWKFNQKPNIIQTRRKNPKTGQILSDNNLAEVTENLYANFAENRLVARISQIYTKFDCRGGLRWQT